jgi:hypothetical protein
MRWPVDRKPVQDAGNGMNDVASNGDIVYRTFDSGALGYNVHRTRSGAALGRAIVRDGLAWVLIDRTVLEVDP